MVNIAVKREISIHLIIIALFNLFFLQSEISLAGAVFYHSDHLGSSWILADYSGQIVEDVSYYPYGGVVSRVEPGMPRTSYQYTGQEFDQESSIYYFGFRYYGTGLGKFISRDPIINHYKPQDLNLYAYAWNSPLTYFDPDGRHEVKTSKGSAIAHDHAEDTHQYFMTRIREEFNSYQKKPYRPSHLIYPESIGDVVTYLKKTVDNKFQADWTEPSSEKTLHYNCYSLVIDPHESWVSQEALNIVLRDDFLHVDLTLKQRHQEFEEQLKSGDLVVYYGYSSELTHVAIYFGKTPKGENVFLSKLGPSGIVIHTTARGIVGMLGTYGFKEIYRPGSEEVKGRYWEKYKKYTRPYLTGEKTPVDPKRNPSQ